MLDNTTEDIQKGNLFSPAECTQPDDENNIEIRGARGHSQNRRMYEGKFFSPKPEREMTKMMTKQSALALRDVTLSLASV